MTPYRTSNSWSKAQAKPRSGCARRDVAWVAGALSSFELTMRSKALAANLKTSALTVNSLVLTPRTASRATDPKIRRSSYKYF